MLDKLYAFVGRIATWPAVALLFILYVLCSLGFTVRTDRLGNEPPLLDLRLWYTPGDVQILFDKLGATGRSHYVLTEITLDLAFPFIYGALLAIFIYRLLVPKLARVLLLIPLIGMVADLLENAGVVLMGSTYNGNAPGMASWVTLFTLIKGVLVRLAMVLVLICAVRSILRHDKGEAGARIA
jgi:hypothetical protein